MVSAREKFRDIRKALASAGVFDPDFEAGEIIKEYGGTLPGELTPEQERRADEALRRRLTGEPLQYIFGQWEFYGLPFRVGKGVLIPRPETELLVDIAIERLDKNSRVLDLFSGSGCVAVAAAVKTGAKCYAVELYDEAYNYLKENIALNSAKVTAVQADACDGSLFGDIRFDAIFANPPYLNDEDMRRLMREVAFEPETALYGGGDGLELYRKFIPAWAGRLTENGFFAVETGETQGEAVSAIMRENGLSPRIIQDYAWLDRVVIGEKSAERLSVNS